MARSTPRRRGAAVTEMALVLPLLLLLSMGIIAFGSVFYVHNNMQHAAREATRRWVVDDVDADGAEAFARNHLATFSITFTVEAVSSGEDRTVSISAPMTAAALGDPFRFFEPERELQVSVTMRHEG